MKLKIVVSLAISVLVVGACGSAGDDPSSSGGGGHDMGSMGAEGSVPGTAADASDAQREIQVTASDDLRFDPATIEVSAGEIVTFVVRNEGENDHEFVLGDEAFQDMHEQDMADDDDMSAMDNAVSVPAGETKELTWKFTGSGSVQFACHEPGHYDGGMIGTIEVSA